MVCERGQSRNQACGWRQPSIAMLPVAAAAVCSVSEGTEAPLLSSCRCRRAASFRSASSKLTSAASAFRGDKGSAAQLLPLLEGCQLPLGFLQAGLRGLGLQAGDIGAALISCSLGELLFFYDIRQRLLHLLLAPQDTAWCIGPKPLACAKTLSFETQFMNIVSAQKAYVWE